MASFIEAILSRDTCSEACWNAREHVCRCSCGGANHGCMLVNGAPQPGRTKRVKETRYRLAAVLDWNNFDDRFQYRSLINDSRFAFQAIPKDCKWPEIAGVKVPDRFIWVDSSISEADAQTLMATAKAHYWEEQKQYHLKECDGQIMYRAHPAIAFPCDRPDWHN